MKMWWICLMFSLEIESLKFDSIELRFISWWFETIWWMIWIHLKRVNDLTRFGYDLALKLRFANEDTFDDLNWPEMSWWMIFLREF